MNETLEMDPEILEILESLPKGEPMDNIEIEKLMDELSNNSEENMEVDEREETEVVEKVKDLKMKLIIAQIELRKCQLKVAEPSEEISEISTEIESFESSGKKTLDQTDICDDTSNETETPSVQLIIDNYVLC